MFNEMDCATPVIYLLSAGADPTDSIEVLARKKKTDVACVSMGEASIFLYGLPRAPYVLTFLHRASRFVLKLNMSETRIVPRISLCGRR